MNNTAFINSRSQKISETRQNQRKELWPDVGEMELWNRKTAKGFTTVPRIVGCMPCVFRELKLKGDPSAVYFDLWCRANDEQFVIVRSEDDLAFTAGYSGERAARTWEERVKVLAEKGFILTKQRGNTKYGYILLRNPYRVLARLHQSKDINDFTWNALRERCAEVGSFTEIDGASKAITDEAKPPSKNSGKGKV